MSKLIQNAVSLLFPLRCLACEKELGPITADPSLPIESESLSASFDFLHAFDSHWCTGCWRVMTQDSALETCRKCGASFVGRNPYIDRCALCLDMHLRFSRTIAIGNYRGRLQELIVRMKNQHIEQLATQLGFILAHAIRQSDIFEEIDLIVPVPQHWFTRFRRGFCASETIADAVGKACDIRSSHRLLRSLRPTKKQGTLSTPGRFKNVHNAIGVHGKQVIQGQTVLLIDDVMTSGATMSEAARALLRNGAAKVYAGVIARGARVS
jgi:ComF family protein